MTLVQVDQHTNGLLAKWLAVQRSDATPDALDFRTRLIASLPDEPFSDKMVSIRLHLVDYVQREPRRDEDAARPRSHRRKACP